MPRVLIWLMVGWLATPALAGEGAEPQRSWTLRAGLFNVEDELPDQSEVGVEVAWAPRSFRGLPGWLRLRPILGVASNEEGGLWGHGGFRWDIQMGQRWWFQPSFAVAMYSSGNGKDLGSTLHFRSAFEGAYALANGDRIGFGFYHLSNANLYARNPGEESVLLSYTWHSRPSD